MQIFGLAGIDIARNIQVVVVGGDPEKAARRGCNGGITCSRVKVSTILWMSCLRSRFLLPSLIKPLLASIKQALTGIAVGLDGTLVRRLFVDDDDAGRNAGAVEEVGEQADNALIKPCLSRFSRMRASALPRNSTPWAGSPPPCHGC